MEYLRFTVATTMEAHYRAKYEADPTSVANARNYITSLRALARAYAEQRNLREAIAALLRANELDVRVSRMGASAAGASADGGTEGGPNTSATIAQEGARRVDVTLLRYVNGYCTHLLNGARYLEAIPLLQSIIDRIKPIPNRSAGMTAEYAEAYDQLGVALGMKGDANAALLSSTTAVQLFEQLESAHLSRITTWRLANATSNLGRRLRGLGKYEDAEKSYKFSVSLFRSPSFNHSNNHLDARMNLAVTLYSLGNAQSEKLDFSSALANTNEAVVILSQLLDQAALNQVGRFTCRRYLATAYMNLGTINRRSGPDDVSKVLLSLENYERAVKRSQELEKENPVDKNIQRLVAMSLLNVGEASLALKQFDKAEKFLNEALHRLVPLAADRPEHRPDLANAQLQLAKLLFNTNRRDDALRLALRARLIFRELVLQSPKRHCDRLVEINDLIANIFSLQGNPPGEAQARQEQKTVVQWMKHNDSAQYNALLTEMPNVPRSLPGPLTLPDSEADKRSVDVANEIQLGRAFLEEFQRLYPSARPLSPIFVDWAERMSASAATEPMEHTQPLPIPHDITAAPHPIFARMWELVQRNAARHFDAFGSALLNIFPAQSCAGGRWALVVIVAHTPHGAMWLDKLEDPEHELDPCEVVFLDLQHVEESNIDSLYESVGCGPPLPGDVDYRPASDVVQEAANMIASDVIASPHRWAGVVAVRAVSSRVLTRQGNKAVPQACVMVSVKAKGWRALGAPELPATVTCKGQSVPIDIVQGYVVHEGATGAKACDLRHRPLRIGAAIGLGSDSAPFAAMIPGTLGCFALASGPDGLRIPGFITAAHVVVERPWERPGAIAAKNIVNPTNSNVVDSAIAHVRTYHFVQNTDEPPPNADASTCRVIHPQLGGVAHGDIAFVPLALGVEALPALADGRSAVNHDVAADHHPDDDKYGRKRPSEPLFFPANESPPVQANMQVAKNTLLEEDWPSVRTLASDPDLEFSQPVFTLPRKVSDGKVFKLGCSTGLTVGKFAGYIDVLVYEPNQAQFVLRRPLPNDGPWTNPSAHLCYFLEMGSVEALPEGSSQRFTLPGDSGALIWAKADSGVPVGIHAFRLSETPSLSKSVFSQLQPNLDRLGVSFLLPALAAT